MTATPEQLAAAWSDIRASSAGSTASRLLGAHLAARYSVDGRLATVLADDPTLDLPLWLAGGRGFAPDTNRHLLAALLCGFAAAEARSLAGAITAGEADEIAEHLWSRSEAEMGEAVGVRAEYDPLAVDADPIEVLVELAVAAGAMLGGHRGKTPKQLAGALGEVLVLERDVRNLIPLLRGRRVNRAARLMADHAELDLGDASSFHLLLGMAGLGQGREAVCVPWKAALESAAALAAEFDSPALAAWIAGLVDRYETVAERDGSLIAGVAELIPLPVFGRMEQLAGPYFDLALDMARGFLLADTDLRESWEVHRRRFLSHDVVAAPFPAGLILDVLARSGLDVADHITRHLDRLAAQGFTYYDAPEFIWVETDTVGTVLRLLDHLEDREPWAALMEPLVAQAVAAMEATGTVPVWLVDDLEAVARSGMVLLGDDCGAIQARLVAALCDRYPGAVPADVIDALLDRFVTTGLSIGVNYPPLFTAGAIRKLLTAADGVASDEALSAAAGALRRELEPWAAAGLTPMEGALLVSACLDSPDADLVDRRLVETILDAQDPDGGWPAEPLFFVPNKGGSVTWHRSRLLTTACCFDALSRWSTGLRVRQNPG